MRIRVENVSFAYPLHPVLSQVSFSVADAEILSILGPNGSGKSTLLRLIARILLPAEGMILLNEQPLNSYKRRDLARQIAYVPQEVPWLFPFTVMEVVLMGRSPYLGRLGFENERDLAVCRNAMELTDIT
ncbi:MAG: ABC transporter ATP-binding protein, partial [Ignavibacteriales bacterium]|nr:ABC transporter ATP-binding protein [Ignavibacteriales bacterium]